jgi:ribosome-binding factor A
MSPLISSMVKKRRERHKFTGVIGSERGASQRQLRVGEELRHALAKILRDGECRDPALENTSVTVCEVKMSPDLRTATAFVMPLAGTNATEIVAGLNRSAAFLKGRIAREVLLRNTPSLSFVLDQSFDQADRISALLARPEVARDLPPPSAGTEDRDDAG